MDVRIMRDGLQLYGRLDKKNPGKTPIAILFHGFAGNLGYEKESLYQKIADSLNKAGIAVIRFDFNGQGKSEGKFNKMNILNEIGDGIAILEYVRSLDFVTDIYVIGHSQGGVVGSMLAGYYPDIIKKLVLLAPAATLKEDAVRGECMGTKYETDHIPAIVFIKDGGHHVGGHYFRTAKLLPIYETAQQYEGPVLCIHGRYDALVPKEASVGYGEKLKNCMVKIYDHLDHGIEGEDQEKAISDIQDFLAYTADCRN